MIPASAFTITVVELAAELGVDASALRQRGTRRGIEFRKRRIHPLGNIPCWCVQPKDAERLRELAANRLPAEALEGWLTCDQAARALGLTRPAFYQRRTAGTISVRSATLVGSKQRGHQVRYDPQDVQREARRLGIRPTRPPAGMVPTRTLCVVCGVSRKQVLRWRNAGCPHVMTADNDAHYTLEKVLTWMENRDMTDRKMNRGRVNFDLARQRLAAHLERRKAA